MLFQSYQNIPNGHNGIDAGFHYWALMAILIKLTRQLHKK